ncbi:transposable element Tcb2 transposase [Trichonephila clavipes]|nr:transposable element Tcb2 transposase [Trichonephila clavipes]
MVNILMHLKSHSVQNEIQETEESAQNLAKVGPCATKPHIHFTSLQDLEPFLETGSAGRRPGQGRRWATTPNEDRYLVLTARRHRNMNATLLQQHLRSATGTTVSTQTIRNRLHGVGLYARRPMVCVRLTSRHRRDRREWATEHVNWRRNAWSNVLFSDESLFSVHPDNRRIFIWRDRGSRNNPAFVHESVRFGGGGVLVNEIFRPIVVPYAAVIGDDFILMDDNSRPHRANLVEDSLFEEGIVRMEWPACSPNINPIEHVWDALGRRVAGRQPPPQTLQQLERALLEEWERIALLVINSLIDSMPQRGSTLLAVRNGGNVTFVESWVMSLLTLAKAGCNLPQTDPPQSVERIINSSSGLSVRKELELCNGKSHSL